MRPDDHFPNHSDFARSWVQAFGGTPPLGHILRCDFYDSWTRFHSLPNSKRYAETEHERQTVLSRANSLADELFTENEKLWIISGYLRDFLQDNNTLLKKLEMVQVLEWTDGIEEPEDQLLWNFFAIDVHWKPTQFDWIIDLIADDKDHAIIFDPATGAAFAPYDGGFDIIGLDAEKIAILEMKYASWMPERPDRL